MKKEERASKRVIASVAFVICTVLALASAGCDAARPLVPEPFVTATGATPAAVFPTVPPTVLALVPGCAERVPGTYIISLNVDPRRSPKDDYTLDDAGMGEVATEIAQEYGITVTHIFTGVLGGFSAAIPDAQLASVIADSRIRDVGPNCILQLID